MRRGRHSATGYDMLCDGLWFDKYTELTTEYRVQRKFADYGIRIDKDLIGFLEVKRVTQIGGEASSPG